MAHYLKQCLDSVFKALEGIEGEVFVVDNNSTDDSLEMLDREFGDSLTLIANPDNPGFSKANNQAIQRAQGQYILLLNPDTLVGEETFHTCIRFMEKHPDAGALGVYMQDGWGHFLPESKRALPTPWVSFYKIFGLARLFPSNPTFGKYHLSYLDKTQNHPVDVLSGAYMFMRKSALDDVGLLDEQFFMYGEDIDLSYRFLLAGYQNYYLADTAILHYKGESTKKGSLNYVRIFYQAMLIFAEKHFSGRLQKGFTLAIKIAVYLRAAMAIGQRLVTRFGMPLVEGVLIFGILFGVKSYWEHYVKYIEGVGGSYPPIFSRLYLPLYALTFVLFLGLSGAYKRPFRIRPLFMGPFWAFLAIATATYLFPFILNFSRAIVGLSAIFSSLLAFGLRGLINWKQKGSFFFSETPRKTSLLIGTADEVSRAWAVLHQELSYPAEILGIILYPNADNLPQSLSYKVLGGFPHLHDISALYQADEWIFCMDGIENQKLLASLRHHSHLGVSVKTLPPNSHFVIGPQFIISAAASGKWRSPLWDPSIRRKKYAYEWLIALGLFLSFPLLAFFYRKPSNAISAILKVLNASHSLCGYTVPSRSPLLAPPLKPAFLSLKNRFSTTTLPDLSHLDTHYASHYHWGMDMEILFKGWRELGAQ